MNKKSKAILKLIVVLVLTGAFCVLGYLNAKNIKLGLDLNGGVSITYQTVDENPTKEQMSDTVYKLQLKAQGYSDEAQVYQEGKNRINIDIPGATDANAILEELGEPGTLEFADENGNVLLTGDDVKTATAGMTNENNKKEYVIELNFTEAGAKKFAEATKNNVGKRIFIIYNNDVISSPNVKEAINGGQASISPIESYEEANNIASTIRIGALPVKLTELRSNVIGATLGVEAISTSLKAAAIGIALVILFMLFVYRLPGLASSIALVLYVGLEIVLLQAFEVTLTLPGIAGIVLSIGMAVDANVIIFTRIKEEIGLGKSVRTAIGNGFNKALSAIIDGNVTTIIAAIVLGIFGTGTIKGFAYTLALGIIISMFTALFITKFLLYSFYDMGFDSEKSYGTKVDKENKPFLKFAPKAYVLSLVVIGIGIATMAVNAASGKGAFDYALEFSGGTSTEVVFNNGKVPGNDEIRNFVNGVIPSSNADVTQIVGEDAVVIKTKSLTEEERTKLREAFVDKYKVSKDDINNENISGAVSGEMKTSALMAVIAATICMLIYIIIRFRNVAFGASAVLALIHDVLVVATLYALTRMNVGNTFIACMLTIVGYSINATIIIFDRIRENLAEKRRGETVALIVDKSITQTFSRSINTTVTTLIMVVVLFIMGVSSVREFSLPIIVGLICGAYSSICITGTLWYLFVKKKLEK